MDDLAQYIENWTDLPVVNRTAVTGLFAVETEGWTPMRLPPPPPGTPAAASFDDLPTIFTVLRKLGLELKQQSHSTHMPWHASSPQADEDDAYEAARQPSAYRVGQASSIGEFRPRCSLAGSGNLSRT
jgi:hypothetical protein